MRAGCCAPRVLGAAALCHVLCLAPNPLLAQRHYPASPLQPDTLPTLRAPLPPIRVKDFCIARGYSWVASVANTACAEQDYYEELMRHYRAQKRVGGW